MPKHGEHGSGNLVCSFCGKNRDEVRKLIAGPTVYICDECIELCNDIIAEESESQKQLVTSSSLPKPTEIKRILDQYVIGQEREKIWRWLSQYKTHRQPNGDRRVELQKATYWFGSDGPGKTCRPTLARPPGSFTIADAMSPTEPVTSAKTWKIFSPSGRRLRCSAAGNRLYDET
jgi:ATP-dependent Clp protease ATP-binding subunit ClpX